MSRHTPKVAEVLEYVERQITLNKTQEKLAADETALPTLEVARGLYKLASALREQAAVSVSVDDVVNFSKNVLGK